MEDCALVIIGAGYAGVNALNAATKYLPRGARVVVVDRNHRWGGMWQDVYSHVTLHQPHPAFTAGERDWSFQGNKPTSHLSSKTEILAHFEDIVSAAVQESGIELTTLWGYEYQRHIIEHGRVKLTVTPLTDSKDGPSALPVQVTSDKMIKAWGFDITHKTPFLFPAAAERIHSLVPAELTSPKWTSLMKYSTADKLIWIVGSGKTAMDALKHLSSLGEEVRSRLRCISGRGTWFMKREMLADPEVGHRLYDMFEMYDGSNQQDVYKEMARSGFLHSVIPDPQCYSTGICSAAELDVVRQALSPMNERVVKAHLADVAVNGSSLVMKLRSLDGQSLFDQPLSEGSFIVNCTEHLTLRVNKFDPVVSSDGLVLSPQTVCGFTGPSAHLLTHAWLLGVLGDRWHKFPRLPFDRKESVGLDTQFVVQIGILLVLKMLPSKIIAETKAIQPVPNVPAPLDLQERAAKTIPTLVAKMMKIYPLRFNDDPDAQDVPELREPLQAKL